MIVIRQLAAALVHAYTATGAVCALLALHAVVVGSVREAFAWLAVQVAIDATDGFLARQARVSQVLPLIDGARLDDIVDYLAYVFVPAAVVAFGGLAPSPASWIAAAAMLLASAFGFARVDAKTSDHFFTGFPSYWNIVVLYLVAFREGPTFNVIVIALLAALVFIPLHYVYPSRTIAFRPLTIGLAVVWAPLIGLVIASLPDPPRPLLYASLVFPVYYFLLSAALEVRRWSRDHGRSA